MASPAAAFLAAFASYLAALWLFPKLGLFDFPERYGLKRKRLPYPAGIVAVVVFVLWLMIDMRIAGERIDAQVAGLLTAIVLLAVTAFIDDRRPLPSWFRLLIQILIALIVFVTGSMIFSITNPFGGILKLDTIVIQTQIFGPLPLWSGVFTVVWLLLTINALNWFDGLPGQVSVISVIGFLMLGFLAYFRNGEPEIATISFALAAIAAAGLFFEFPVPRLLLGDTGSMFFGLMIGLLGIFSGGKVATVFLALGIPLIDAAFVILRRLLRGSSPFRGGRDHLHHMLLECGWKPMHIILFTASIGTAFGGIALFLDTAQKGIAFVILTTIVLAITRYASR